jgi:hypothetical protein
MASAALLFVVAVTMLAIVIFRPAKLRAFSSEACPGRDPGWMPVRVKKTRQNKRLEPGSDSIRTDKALVLPDTLYPAQRHTHQDHDQHDDHRHDHRQLH